MRFALYFRALAAIIVIAIFPFFTFAQSVQPVPELTARVIDQTRTLSAAELAELESRLATFEREAGSQIVVLLVTTTAPEDIASYANRVANAWKIGRIGTGDGLLLLVAKQDRKMRIEVAKSLEGAIPDLAAKRIIDEAIVPQFKQDRFPEGLAAGVTHITALIRGESLPVPDALPASLAAKTSPGFGWTDIGIFLFFAVPLCAVVARAVFGPALGTLLVGLGTGLLAQLFTHSYALATLAAVLGMAWSIVGSSGSARSPGGGPSGNGWSSRSSTDNWSGSGGNDGFSSGGGGDFGGGGASGDW